MPIYAQIAPGEGVLDKTINGAWDNLPPEAAALFIVLILLLVGGFVLAYTYMRTYGAKPRSPRKDTPEPSQARIGRETMGWMSRMRAGDVRASREQEAPVSGIDAAQAAQIEALDKHVDRVEREVDHLRKWKERKTKQWLEDSATNQKEERMRTADMMRLSGRISVLEMSGGRTPGGSGVTVFTSGEVTSTVPPTEGPKDEETMG